MEFTFEEMCKEYLLYYIDPLPIELNQISRWSRTDHQTKKQVQIDISVCRQTDMNISFAPANTVMKK